MHVQIHTQHWRLRQNHFFLMEQNRLSLEWDAFGVQRECFGSNQIYSTMVGYAGGYTENPTYGQVCTGDTGHTEVVRVIYDPKTVSLQSLLTVFYNEHDPTEGYKQGNDVGTQYRSAIYWTTDEQEKLVKIATQAFAQQLPKDMKVTTELGELKEFYYAEDYHQQYLHKNPNGYCGLRGSGYKLPQNIASSKGNDEEQKEEL
eukprot:566304_1